MPSRTPAAASRPFEHFIERALFASRWLLAPIYLGLALALVALGLKFFQASIVAISSIHLLRTFMKVQVIENDKIMWYALLHLTFVISAVLLGVLDKMSFAKHREH